MIRCFSVLILLCQQVTHNKTIYEEKIYLIIVTDVNMTSKRVFLQTVTVLLISTIEKKGVYLNKIIVFGVFLSQRSPWIMPSAKRK